MFEVQVVLFRVVVSGFIGFGHWVGVEFLQEASQWL